MPHCALASRAPTMRLNTRGEKVYWPREFCATSGGFSRPHLIHLARRIIMEKSCTKIRFSSQHSQIRLSARARRAGYAVSRAA